MKKHILLIEHSHDGYLHFMQVLNATNIECKVTYATDFRHALKMLQFLVPHCVFIRLDAEGKNALECIEKIRLHDSLKEVKLVAYDDDIIKKLALIPGLLSADFCIDTPDESEDLRYLLNDVFQMRENNLFSYH